MGISSTAITYNVEARMYSLVAMFVMFAFKGVYKMLKEEKWGSLIFVISSLGAAYSHYYALISVGVFYLLLLILTIRKKFDYKS